MTSSRADKYTESSKIRDVFSDFTTDLTPHPNTKNLVRLVNEDAVRRSIRNLILTDKYERLMQPDIGSNIRKLLFEPIDTITADTLKMYIQQTIENYEKRAKVIEVRIETDVENEKYTVSIYFFLINSSQTTAMTINLNRIR